MTTSDLTCREFVEVITDYHELALPPGERIRVEQHLVVCSACTRYEQQLRATVRVAATIELDDLGPESRRALLASLDQWLARRGDRLQVPVRGLDRPLQRRPVACARAMARSRRSAGSVCERCARQLRSTRSPTGSTTSSGRWSSTAKSSTSAPHSSPAEGGSSHESRHGRSVSPGVRPRLRRPRPDARRADACQRPCRSARRGSRASTPSSQPPRVTPSSRRTPPRSPPTFSNRERSTPSASAKAVESPPSSASRKFGEHVDRWPGRGCSRLRDFDRHIPLVDTLGNTPSRADPAGGRRRLPPRYPSYPRNAWGRKALLSRVIPAKSRSARKYQDRPVTPEVAGSSPVAPVKSLQIGIFCCRLRRKRPPASFQSRTHPARQSPLEPSPSRLIPAIRGSGH